METINNGTIYSINSIKLWVETFGKVSDKNIILIPGAMAPAVFWTTSFCKALVNMGFFVIRFDNRDMGYSTHFEPCRPNTNVELAYSINDMADDVNGILNQFSIKKAFIAGHSLGGSIAQIFAINYPQKTEQLYLLSSPILATDKNIYTKTDEKIMNEMWQVLMSNKLYPDYERGKGEFLRAWKYLNGKYPIDMEMAEDYTKKIYETETIEPAWNHTKVQENIPDIYNGQIKSEVQKG